LLGDRRFGRRWWCGRRCRLGGRDRSDLDAEVVRRTRLGQRKATVGVVKWLGFEWAGVGRTVTRRSVLRIARRGIDLEGQSALIARVRVELVTRLLSVGLRIRLGCARVGHDDTLLLVVRLGGDRRSGGAGRKHKDAGGEKSADTSRPIRLRRQNGREPILPTDGAVGMKAKPLVEVGLRPMNIQDRHRTPPPRCCPGLSCVGR
jgi:hypothetical protein